MGSIHGYEDLVEVYSALQNDAARYRSTGSNPPLNDSANTFQHYDFIMVDSQHNGGSVNKGKKRSLPSDEEKHTTNPSTIRSRRFREKRKANKNSNEPLPDEKEGPNYNDLVKHPVASTSNENFKSFASISDPVSDCFKDPTLPVGVTYVPSPKGKSAWAEKASAPPPLSPENEWIRCLRKKWDAPSISVMPKLHEVGIGIIEKLMRIKSLPPKPIDDSMVLLLGRPKRSSVSPSIRLVLTDLLQGEDPNVTEFISRSGELGIGPLDVLASMMNPNTYCNMGSSERRLYGALDIPMTETGLKMCRYVVERFEDGKDNYVPKKVWTTTFTPPGAITHTHMDFYGRHQYMVHLFGHKLWLLWPPTPKNMAMIWSNHTQHTEPDLTERCIDEMEGLQVFYTTEEQIFIIKPNVIHACVSVSISGHSATWFWRLETYRESLRMMEWGLDWLTAKVSSDAPMGDYKEGLEVIEDELKAWKELLKRNKELKELKVEVERMEGLLKEVSGFFKPVEIGKDGRILKRKKGRKDE